MSSCINQFITDVDSSGSGIGEVLSLRSGKDNNTHYCAYLSRKLSLAEGSYYIGDQKMLADKTAIGE